MKNKLPYISALLLIFAGLLVMACQKKSVTYHVRGVLTDETNNQSIANQELVVYIQENDVAAELEFMTLTTNQSGDYSFDIDRAKFVNIRIAGTRDGYFPFQAVISLDQLKVDEDNVLNLETTAKSWVNIIFNNPGGESTDEIRYTKLNGKRDCIDCCPDNQQSRFGAGSDTVTCITDGETYYSIDYVVIGTTDSGIRDAFCPAGDTAEIVLNY